MAPLGNRKGSWRRILGLGAVLLGVLLSPLTMAENWPGWRGDGSGVSPETGLAEHWSSEENIVWKTEVPGHGHSSPIVWGDFVFLTSAENSVELQVFRGLSTLLLWVLGLFAIWWALDSFFGRPLDPHRPFLDPATATSVPRRLGLLAVYGSVAVLCLLLWRWAFARFPAELYGLGLVSDSRSIEVSGQSRLVWLAISLSCAAGVFLAHLRFGRRATTPPGADGRPLVVRLMALGLGVFGFVVVASFLGINLLRAIAVGQEHVSSATGHWIRNALVCALGWLAAVVVAHPRSPWRWIGALVALPALWVLYRGPQDAPIDWWQQSPKSALVLTGIAGLLLVLVSERWWFPRRSAASPTERPSGLAAALGPLMVLLLALVHTASLAMAAPSNVLLHQVLAFDRTSGKLMWRTVCDTRGRASIHTVNTYASPTPVTDGERVYANFGEAGTYALDTNGRLLWSYQGEIPEMQWGAAASPVLWGDTLIVTHDTDTRAFSLAFDARSGELRWQNQRRPEETTGLDSFSTPIFVDTADGTQLVHRGNEAAYGYDPGTGEERWSLELPGKETVASPVLWNDLVILPYGGNIPIQMLALRLEPGAEGVEPVEVWEERRMLPGMASPVVWGDRIYSVTDGGVATGRDAASGELLWRKRLPGRYYSAITAADGKIYFSNLEGSTVVIAAGTEGEIVATNTLDDEEIWATMAISQGDLYLRGLRHLYRIGPGGG